LSLPVQTDLIWFELPKIELMSPSRAIPPHPVNTRCHGKLRGTNPIESNQNSSTLVQPPSTLVPSLSTPNSILSLICCSSFIWAVIESILAGLPSLEQTKVFLPLRGPSLEFVGFSRQLHEDWSDRLPISV
jgi:hypothetical protein